jgi:hypothetical protein
MISTVQLTSNKTPQKLMLGSTVIIQPFAITAIRYYNHFQDKKKISTKKRIQS